MGTGRTGRYRYHVSTRPEHRGPDGGCTWRVVREASRRVLLQIECGCGCPEQHCSLGTSWTRFQAARKEVRDLGAALEEGGAGRERAMRSHRTHRRAPTQETDTIQKHIR